MVGGPFGSRLVSRDYKDAGVPVIRGGNLPLDQLFSLADLVFVSEEKVARDLFGNLAFPGDIVITQRGTLGQVGLVPKSSPYPRFVVSQSQMKLAVDPDKADSRFVFYALKSPEGQHEIHKRAITAGVPHINLALFQELQVPLPPLPVQRKIAAILSVYDDLIENNNSRIKLLEEIAQRIYREWFVDFRYPGHENVPLVNSELGPIPAGWSVRALFDVAEITFGFPFKSELFNADQGTPVIRIRDIPIGESRTLTTEVPGSSYRVADGDILVGMDGEFHMGRWSAGDAWLNQRVARFRVASEATCRYGLYLGLEAPIADWNRSIVGTTVAHLGKRHLQLVKIIAAMPRLAAALGALLDPIFDAEISLRKAVRVLRASRDLLLPRLISGEVDVENLDVAA
jgi:type I restriction enzyme S subunit